MAIKVRTIEFIHDPEAAKMWFEAYIELVKDELLTRQSKKFVPVHTIEQTNQGGTNDEDCSVLPKLNGPTG